MNTKEAIKKFWKLAFSYTKEEAESLFKTVVNAAVGNVGEIRSTFNVYVTEKPGKTEGNVTIEDGWMVVAKFTPPLDGAKGAAVVKNFYQIVANHPKLKHLASAISMQVA